MTTQLCPLCERLDGESRADVARRTEATAHSSQTRRNKAKARLARACFEPLTLRQSKIFFLAQAQRSFGEMDISLHMDDFGEPFEMADAKARRLAEEGRLVAPALPWWILDNYRG